MSDAEFSSELAPLTRAATATNRDEWFAAIEALTAEEGYIQPIGEKHWAFFWDAGTTLLVSFQTLDDIRARPDQMPLAHSIATDRGWSHLCLIADGPTWFRDIAVYRYFDRLVDETFLEDFDHVLFFGAGMGGYAACAYSVTAPGARILALNPRATLEPVQAGWDARDRAERRLNFTARYGYAPDMLEGAAHAVVIHDPTIRVEAMHAALFRAPYISRLSARHMGDQLDNAFDQIGILPDLIDGAMKGTLTAAAFASLWRKRRDFAPYLRNLLNKAESSGRIAHEVLICKNVSSRLRAPRFARRLAKLTGAPIEAD